MNIDRKKINCILEYFLIFILFIIGIKKGGYYKSDSLVGVYIIQIISVIFYLFNIKDFKKNKVINSILLLFSISYFVPSIFNFASLSGALNIAIKIYTMYLMYCIVINSDNKEKYIKAIVIMTVIFSILGIDELGSRLLDKPLNIIGSGYLQDNDGKLSSVIQYANLMGILCVISIIYLLDKNSNKEHNKLIHSGIETIITFLVVCIFLTQSKMSILLYIIGSISVCIINKNYKYIIKNIVVLLYSFIISLLMTFFNIYLVTILSLLVYYLLDYILNLYKVNKYSYIVYSVVIILMLIVLVINKGLVLQSSTALRFEEYINNFSSTKLRMTYYKDGLKILRSTPMNLIFGIGGNGFRTMYETVQNVEYISLEVHSLFIQVLVESGVLGLILFLTAIIYMLIKSKNKVNKLMFIILIIYAMFDVYLTYAYMLLILAIIMAINSDERCELNIKEKIVNYVLFGIIFVISTSFSIAYLIEPTKVNELNNTLEAQEDIINKCNLALKFDPYDISYRQNYTNACRTYLEIMDIKKELYGQDSLEKRKQIASLIEKNVNLELKYEKNNKYAIEDNVYNICKYLDYIVQNNYSLNLDEGYVYYLDYMLKTAEKLKTEHKYNSLSNEMYDEVINNIYEKYTMLNILLNNEKIKNTLHTIEENNKINL